MELFCNLNVELISLLSVGILTLSISILALVFFPNVWFHYF